MSSAEAKSPSEIYSTAGDFDLLVKFYVEAGTDIGHFRQREGAVLCRASRTRLPSSPSRRSRRNTYTAEGGPSASAARCRPSWRSRQITNSAWRRQRSPRRRKPALSAVRRTPSSRAASAHSMGAVVERRHHRRRGKTIALGQKEMPMPPKMRAKSASPVRSRSGECQAKGSVTAPASAGDQQK